MLLICSIPLFAQEGRGDLRFVFYNVENLFDPFDDSLCLDNEFLPGGDRHWTWERFLLKEQRIYKVLASIGGWRPPELIGLCEVENRFVLNWLTRETPLLKYNYRLIHRDSPDKRGIDLALLYLPSHFRPLACRWIPVLQGREPSRDILYVKGLVMDRDTVHLIICHWPSRWEGYLESLPDRLEAARLVRELADSIGQAGMGARILIAGDLNDEPGDPSLSTILRARMPEIPKIPETPETSETTEIPETSETPEIPETSETPETLLFDACRSETILRDSSLSGTSIYDTRTPGRLRDDVHGTLKYRGRWYEFDHIFVNGAFLKDSSLYVRPGGKKIFAPDYLLEADPGSTGRRPFRTYQGYAYHGGFSDHLPVYIDLWRSQ